MRCLKFISIRLDNVKSHNQQYKKVIEEKLKERNDIKNNRENGSWLEIDEEVKNVLNEILSEVET